MVCGFRFHFDGKFWLITAVFLCESLSTSGPTDRPVGWVSFISFCCIERYDIRCHQPGQQSIRNIVVISTNKSSASINAPNKERSKIKMFANRMQSPIAQVLCCPSCLWHFIVCLLMDFWVLFFLFYCVFVFIFSNRNKRKKKTLFVFSEAIPLSAKGNYSENWLHQEIDLNIAPLSHDQYGDWSTSEGRRRFDSNSKLIIRIHYSRIRLNILYASLSCDEGHMAGVVAHQ